MHKEICVNVQSILDTVKTRIVGSDPDGLSKLSKALDQIYEYPTYRLLSPEVRDKILNSIFEHTTTQAVITDASTAFFFTLDSIQIIQLSKLIANSICIDGPNTDSNELPDSVKKYSPGSLFELNTINIINRIFRKDPIKEISKYLINNKLYMFIVLIKITNDFIE